MQEHICRSYGIGLIDVLHTFRLTRSNKKVQPLLCLRQMGNRIGSNISLGPAFKRHIEGNHNLCYKIPNTTIISKHWGGGIAGIHLPSMPFTDTPPPSKNPTACISNQHCTYIFVITPHWIKLWLQQCNAMKQTHWMCFHKCSNLPRSIVASTCNVLWGKSIVTISCLLLIFFWLSAQPCSHDVHTQTKTTQTQ